MQQEPDQHSRDAFPAPQEQVEVRVADEGQEGGRLSAITKRSKQSLHTRKSKRRKKVLKINVHHQRLSRMRSSVGDDISSGYKPVSSVMQGKCA